MNVVMPFFKPRFVLVMLLMVAISSACSSNDKKPVESSSSTTTKNTSKNEPTAPELSTDVVLENLNHPWDLGFLPDKTLIFTERNGELSALKNGEVTLLAKMKDVEVEGEGGLLGLAVDSNFEKNRYIYTCFNHNDGKRDVRVVRYEIDEKITAASNPAPIVTGIPAKDSGRHSGCRIRSASDGTLFIGTGDAANENNPQNPKKLGGKILHVDRNGKGVKGNLSDPFDNRILNYGHRNVQGIVLFDKEQNGVFGFSIEHGSDKDDEVNLIKNGNFGWDPGKDYEENVPMTDTKKFPDAIKATWTSGYPTIAPSGATFLKGTKWGAYENALAIAVLKGEKVKILKFDDNYKIVLDTDVLTEFGRIRSAVQGPDGNLYIATDSDDGKIIKVTPKIKN